MIAAGAAGRPGATLDGMNGPDISIYTGDACGFCTRAKRLLDAKGVGFEEIHIDRWDHAERERLVRLTGRYTVPQVIVGGTPIGGWHELKELEDTGRLDAVLGLA